MALSPSFKQTDLGKIPEDWSTEALANCAVRITDGEHLTPVRSETGYYLLSARNIWNGRIDLTDVDYVPEVEYRRIRRRCNPEVGDIVISCSGSIGRVATVPQGLDCVMVRSAALIKPLREIFHGKYGQYFLQSASGQAQIFASLNQGAQANLFLNHIQKLQIALPPTKTEQEAIAEALSDADALIESLEQLLVKKRQIKQGTMQELLTGKRRLPGFDGEWEMKRLGDVADTDPENLSSDTRPDFSFNYISLEDVDEGSLTGHSEQLFESAPSRARRKLRSHDVLVSTVRPNLRSHLLFQQESNRWIGSTGFCVVRCKTGMSHHGYVYAHMFGGIVNRQIESLLTGSNYPAINSRDVRALEIPFPSYAEQTAIATILSDMDADIAALEAKLAKARHIKQGMMQQLLTGQIRLV